MCSLAPQHRPPLCTAAFLILPPLCGKKKNVHFVRGGRLMISPACPIWPVEIYLSAHLSSWAQSGAFSCWLRRRCLQRRDMKNATEVVVIRRLGGPGEITWASMCSASIFDGTILVKKNKNWLPLPVNDMSQEQNFSVFSLQKAQKMDYRRIRQHWIDH